MRGTHPPAAGPDGAYWYCPGPPTPTPGRGITLERGPCRGFIKPRHGTFPRGFRSPGPPAWPTLGRALGTRALGHPQGHPQKGFLGDEMVRTKWAVNTVGKIGRKGVGRRAASLAHGARGTRHTRRGRPSHSAPTAKGRRRGWRPPPGLGLVHRADGRSRRLAWVSSPARSRPPAWDPGFGGWGGREASPARRSSRWSSVTRRGQLPGAPERGTFPPG